jgi:DNA adenine methylase
VLVAVNNLFLRPFLKWAGGKRQLLPEIRGYVPERFNTYFEPFLGAGAVLFDLQPEVAIVNDINFELINAYKVIKDDVDALLDDLTGHKNEKEYYYRLRNIDREDEFSSLSPVERASRIIYLNKTCFNGLFRVNSQGQFNVPFGYYKNPKFADNIVLRAAHRYLAHNEITILNDDFETAVIQATKGDFVYFDPPYDPVSDTSSFTGYSLEGFNRNSQVRLKQVFDDLSKRGCKVLLSNSATPFIRDLYKEYTIITISANRAINSDALGRGKIDEILVMNYAQ